MNQEIITLFILLLLSSAIASDLSNDVIMNALSFLATPEQIDLRLINVNFRKASDRINNRHINNVNFLINYTKNIRKDSLSPASITHIKQIYDDSRFHQYYLRKMPFIIPKLYRTKSQMATRNSKLMMRALNVNRKFPKMEDSVTSLLIDISQKLTRFLLHRPNQMRKCLSFLYLSTWNYLSSGNNSLLPELDRIYYVKADANKEKFEYVQNLMDQGLILWDSSVLHWKWTKKAPPTQNFHWFCNVFGVVIKNELRQKNIWMSTKKDFIGYVSAEFVLKLLHDSFYDLSQIRCIEDERKYRRFVKLVTDGIKYLALDSSRFGDLEKLITLLKRSNGYGVISSICPEVVDVFKDTNSSRTDDFALFMHILHRLNDNCSMNRVFRHFNYYKRII